MNLTFSYSGYFSKEYVSGFALILRYIVSNNSGHYYPLLNLFLPLTQLVIVID